MSDKALIVIGVVVFLVLITFPVWWNMASGPQAAPPDPKLPASGECVLARETMKVDHMNVLLEWRDLYVREDNRTVTVGGREIDRSLTKGCMKTECHASKKDFCDECHNYSAVKPYCWDCHIEPEEVQP